MLVLEEESGLTIALLGCLLLPSSPVLLRSSGIASLEVVSWPAIGLLGCSLLWSPVVLQSLVTASLGVEIPSPTMLVQRPLLHRGRPAEAGCPVDVTVPPAGRPDPVPLPQGGTRDEQLGRPGRQPGLLHAEREPGGRLEGLRIGHVSEDLGEVIPVEPGVPCAVVEVTVAAAVGQPVAVLAELEGLAVRLVGVPLGVVVEVPEVHPVAVGQEVPRAHYSGGWGQEGRCHRHPPAPGRIRLENPRRTRPPAGRGQLPPREDLAASILYPRGTVSSGRWRPPLLTGAATKDPEGSDREHH